MHTTPLAKRIPRKLLPIERLQDTRCLKACQTYRAPGQPKYRRLNEICDQSWKKTRGKKLCPEFQVKEVAKKHDTRKTFTSLSVCRTDFQLQKRNVRGRYKSNNRIFNPFQRTTMVRQLTLPLVTCEKANSNSKPTVCLTWASFLRLSLIHIWRCRRRG